MAVGMEEGLGFKEKHASERARGMRQPQTQTQSENTI